MDFIQLRTFKSRECPVGLSHLPIVTNKTGNPQLEGGEFYLGSQFWWVQSMDALSKAERAWWKGTVGDSSSLRGGQKVGREVEQG